MRRMGRAVCLLCLCAALLAGCQGKPLPEGMVEEDLLKQGQEVLLSLVEGDYESVYGRMREDVKEGTSAEEIQALVLRQLDGAGVYKQIESRMATGQSSNGEEYGVAVMYCEYSEDDVLVRLAFDPEMALIGMEIKKQ